jgi:hypothetical protein
MLAGRQLGEMSMGKRINTDGKLTISSLSPRAEQMIWQIFSPCIGKIIDTREMIIPIGHARRPHKYHMHRFDEIRLKYIALSPHKGLRCEHLISKQFDGQFAKAL